MNLIMNKIVFILIVFAVLMRCNALSQVFPRTLLIEKDSCVAFTIKQSKQMAKWNEKRKESVLLNDICSKQILFMDSIILNQTVQIEKGQFVSLNYKTIIENKNDLLIISESEKLTLKHEIKIQKRQKWLIAGFGTFITTLLTIITLK